jgi:hypothetical protein
LYELVHPEHRVAETVFSNSFFEHFF